MNLAQCTEASIEGSTLDLHSSGTLHSTDG